VNGALVPEVAEARDHVRGSRGPALLIFGDYECPYTRIAYRSVKFLEADGVPFRFVFRHFPLVEIHPHALAAAEASEAAAAQARFWPMHDLLFRRQKGLERADLERYATERPSASGKESTSPRLVRTTSSWATKSKETSKSTSPERRRRVVRPRVST